MSMSADGPSLPIILVALYIYPVEAANIKKVYLTQPQLSVEYLYPNTLTIQHPGEVGQEAEAKKGEVKILILCL